MKARRLPFTIAAGPEMGDIVAKGGVAPRHELEDRY